MSQEEPGCSVFVEIETLSMVLKLLARAKGSPSEDLLDPGIAPGFTTGPVVTPASAFVEGL